MKPNAIDIGPCQSPSCIWLELTWDNAPEGMTGEPGSELAHSLYGQLGAMGALPSGAERGVVASYACAHPVHVLGSQAKADSLCTHRPWAWLASGEPDLDPSSFPNSLGPCLSSEMHVSAM